MNAGKAVYGILSANTGVTDIVGTRIFPEIAEQEAQTPFVIYQLQSVAPEDTHDGPSKLDEVRFEFLCYADSYNEAADLGVAVRAALDRVSGTYNGVNVESIQFNDVDIELEYDPRRYSQVLKFTFRIKRDDIEIALGTPVTGAQLGDLSDVNVDGATDNQVLSYDAATDTWVPANDGGALALNDLSDVDAGEPEAGQLLSYGQGDWVTIAQDELEVPISSVTGLQAALDATPDSLDDLTDVKIIGTPSEGDALVYQSGFFSLGTAGASTLGGLDDVNTTGAGVGSTITYNGATWEISAAELPSDAIYYHNRYATEAETLRAGATDTVELYYTAQADGDGLAESAESDTATTGYDIRRKLYYAEKAQADPDEAGDWTQFADIADDTTYANAKAALLAYLKERTGGTVPISLKMTWEEVAEAPTFTGLLNETYGSGAAAAYSVRRLNGLYTGAAIQVERSSDNTTQDIGFTVDGDLDESALTTFCTGTVCKVRTWYDQSQSGGTGSGNDAVQTTHANQPIIYTGGAIVKENGRAALSIDDGFMDAGSAISLTSDYFITSIFNTNSTQSFNMLLGSYNDTKSYLSLRTNEIKIRNAQSSINNFAGVAIGLAYNQRHLLTLSRASNSLQPSVDGNAHTAQTTSGTYNFDELFAYNSGLGSYRFGGNCQEIILYAKDQVSNRTDIEENVGDYFTQNTPLLDTYTGAAAAYSLRKLRTAYTGSAIRVRRSNDNAETDIGFNVFGELDTVSLAAHCGSNDGFVKTWYDQSGNANDATQTTAASQPKIYDSVTGVVTENGKPALQFDGTTDYFEPTITIAASDYSLHAVTKDTSNDMFLFDAQSGRLVFDGRGGTRGVYFDGSWKGTSHSGTAQQLQSIYAISPSSGQSYVDGSQINTGLTYTQTAIGGTIALGASFGGADHHIVGVIQEFVLYDSDQSTNRTNIESNINTFYSIY